MGNTIPAKIVRKVIFDILIERSYVIDEARDEMVKNGIKQGLPVISDYAGELGWTACGTRVLADDILEGIMSLEEAVEVLSYEERREAKARCQKWLDEKRKIEQILQADKIAEKEEQTIFKIIPELLDEKGFSQNNPWHIYDVWNHTKKVFENSKPDKEIRLVLLLHDIGKPHSFQDDENGIRHFKGHSQKSAEISEQILKRLGYSENEISQICFLIANHDKTIQPEVINASNLETYKKLLYVQYCDASGYNPEYIKRVFDRLDAIAFYLKSYQNRDDDTKGEDRR